MQLLPTAHYIRSRVSDHVSQGAQLCEADRTPDLKFCLRAAMLFRVHVVRPGPL